MTMNLSFIVIHPFGEHLGLIAQTQSYSTTKIAFLRTSGWLKVTFSQPFS